MRTAERFDPGDLRKAGGAGIGVGHQTGDVRCQIGAHDAIAHTPAGHRVSLGKTVEQNTALLHAVHRHDGVMFTLKDEAAVNLVAQDHNVAVADRARDAVDVLLL